jgi:hypothetical protein
VPKANSGAPTAVAVSQDGGIAICRYVEANNTVVRWTEYLHDVQLRLILINSEETGLSKQMQWHPSLLDKICLILGVRGIKIIERCSLMTIKDILYQKPYREIL